MRVERERPNDKARPADVRLSFSARLERGCWTESTTGLPAVVPALTEALPYFELSKKEKDFENHITATCLDVDSLDWTFLSSLFFSW